MVKALARDPMGHQSEVSMTNFDIATTHWRILSRDSTAISVVDGDENTFWTTGERDYNQVIIDLGEPLVVKGFTYLPPQNRWFSGIISEYALYTSLNGGNYQLVQSGEFSNIVNSPVLQRIVIPERICRFLKLRGVKTTDKNPAAFAEVGILTK